MSASFGGGAFPGMPAAAAPGAQPQQQQPAGSGFVLVIPPDMDWQPIDSTDVLEKDGYYMARIKTEKAQTGEKDNHGVWLTLELGDPDVVGKQLSKFMVDPRATKGDTWWTWRSLLRSITGQIQGGQAGMTYTPGALAGQIVYIRTGAYIDKKGGTATGVDAFITRPEWEEAVTKNTHRWEAKPKSRSEGGGPAGALPGAGSSAAFPGLGSGGLPGLPNNPMNPVTAPSAPQPAAAAPMAQAAAAPVGFPAVAPPVAPVAPAAPQFGGFPAAPGFGGGFAPPAAPPAAPTAPQPGATQAFPGFPGFPAGNNGQQH